MAAKRSNKKRKRTKPKSPADPNNRLKPISLDGMDFDEVMRKLIRPAPKPG